MSFNKANQAVMDEEVTPQAKHKQKIYEDEQARLKSLKVLSQHLFIVSDHQHPKGGKVRLVTKKSDGNNYSQYVGRELLCKDLINKYQKKGIKILR